MQFDSLDHIGIAVSDLDQALDLYCRKLGFIIAHREKILERNIELVFLTLAGTTLELLYPLGEGVLKKFINKSGPGLHHLCYKVQNIEEALKQLEIQGFELIDKTPRAGAKGTLIAFVHPKSLQGTLLELCEHPA